MPAVVFLSRRSEGGSVGMGKTRGGGVSVSSSREKKPWGPKFQAAQVPLSEGHERPHRTTHLPPFPLQHRGMCIVACTRNCVFDRARIKGVRLSEHARILPIKNIRVYVPLHGVPTKPPFR